MDESFTDYDAYVDESFRDCRSIGCDRCAQQDDDFCLRCRDEIDALRSAPARRRRQRGVRPLVGVRAAVTLLVVNPMLAALTVFNGRETR